MSQTAFLQGAETYYVAAMQKREDTKSKSPGYRLIERANEVSIFDVLQDFFDLYLPREGESYKSRCPFAYEHEDGGLDKGWRTYPGSNSSYCFPMHGFLPPVQLVALKENLRPVKAAEKILRYYDLLRPLGYRKRMEALIVERERSEAAKAIGNPQHVVEAVNLALSHMPSYQRRQYDSDVLDAMEIVLGSLDTVLAMEDPAKLREWYSRATKALHRVIEREDRNEA